MKINHLKDMLAFMSVVTKNSLQGDMYRAMYDCAKEVKVVPCSEVFGVETVEKIKSLGLIMKGCYKNATLIADAIEGVKYVEGQVMCGIPIDHAFNEYNGKYFDATLEFVLGEDVTEREYITVGEYDIDDVREVLLKKGTYGEIWQTKFFQK